MRTIIHLRHDNETLDAITYAITTLTTTTTTTTITIITTTITTSTTTTNYNCLIFS